MKKKYHIYGKKNGCKEFYDSVIGRETAEEEVNRLNNADDNITYHKEFEEEVPENPQTQVMY